ncbi:hypothetical protein [Streptomyces caelestis]|uniref:hypothetical protein n=1 Tax=Streptomyces caelestis TaxID=36816 RepID=UPI0036FB199A
MSIVTERWEPTGSAFHAAVMTHSWATVTEPVWGILDSEAPFDERLRGFLTMGLRRLRHDARFRALLTLTLDGSHNAAGLSEGRAAKASGLADWQRRLEAVFSERATTRSRRDAAGGNGTAGEQAGPAQHAANLLVWLCGTALLAATDPALLPPDDATGVAPILRGLLS